MNGRGLPTPCNVSKTTTLSRSRERFHLELQGFGLLPVEVLVGEMAVLGRLAVDGLGEVEFLDDDAGPEVEVVEDDADELGRGPVGGAVAFDEHGERLGDTDGVGELHEGTSGEFRVHQRLGDPSGQVRGRSVHFRVVFAGKGAASVRTPTAIRVDDDLAACQTGVTLRATDDEETGRLDLDMLVWEITWQESVNYVVNCSVIQQVGGDDLLDDLLLDLFPQLFGGNLLAMLGANDNRVDPLWHYRSTVVFVFNRYLGLGVGSQPRQTSVVARLFHGTVETVCELDGQWHIFRSLVSSVTEHDPLVAGTELLQCLVIVQPLRDVGRLLLDGDQDVAGLVVKAFVGVVVANVPNGVPDDFLIIERSFGGDLSEDHDHAWTAHMSSACQWVDEGCSYQF